jgi:formylglycine-generating enzyme
MARLTQVAICTVLFATLAPAWARIEIQTVPVGNPGNAGDTRYPDTRFGITSFGAVAYTYNIGKYEVTAGQYTEFLNNKGDVDTYGLYSAGMANTSYGSGITRSGGGTVGNPYIYSVASDFVNRPVNYVSYWDACRFTNWLQNGQGGADTETGTYTLNGYNGDDGRTIQRNAGATWAVTSEDEWYKAAYYSPSTSSYYDYPTSSNSINTGMANYESSVGHTTDVGSYGYSSPYGTFDQGGNVWEWNEALGSYRVLRGGPFNNSGGTLHASARAFSYPANEGYGRFGFRVSEVPEPATLAIFALGAVGLLRRRRIWTNNSRA